MLGSRNRNQREERFRTGGLQNHVDTFGERLVIVTLTRRTSSLIYRLFGHLASIATVATNKCKPQAPSSHKTFKQDSLGPQTETLLKGTRNEDFSLELLK